MIITHEGNATILDMNMMDALELIQKLSESIAFSQKFHQHGSGVMPASLVVDKKVVSTGFAPSRLTVFVK